MKEQLHQEITGEFKKDYHTDFNIIQASWFFGIDNRNQINHKSGRYKGSWKHLLQQFSGSGLCASISVPRTHCEE